MRLTITNNNNSESNAVLGLCSIRLLTGRWGDQGKGSEYEYPYSWDGNCNMTTTGQMTATQFNGALSGNATSATKATQDGSGNTITSTYLKKSGDTITGTLGVNSGININGSDLNLKTSGTSSNDSGDIIWFYGNGTEKMRVWSNNEYTSKSGPNYRVYKTDGTQLYSGTLVLGDGTGASGTWDIDITGSASSATTANYLSTYAASGSSSLEALKAIFDTIPKSKGTAVRLEHGSHSMAFGWFLSGYSKANAYGGWFISDYGTPRWIGVDNGVWNEQTFITNTNYTSYTVTKTGSGASGTWGINISGNAAKDGSGNTITSTYAKLSGATFTGAVAGTSFTGTSFGASSYLACNTGNSSTAGGIALYSTSPTSYGIAMRGTSNGGKHGYVQGDWAIYNYMSGSDSTNKYTRGWIFKNASDNVGVASISGAGNAAFSGSVTIGANTDNTSGCRLVMDNTLKCLNFVFA